MSNTKTGGPAFPVTSDNYANAESAGMTLREYAAIKLRVPDSGIDWLDSMIRTAQRDELAAKAMPFEFKDYWDDFEKRKDKTIDEYWRYDVAESCYAMADVMLKARDA